MVRENSFLPPGIILAGDSVHVSDFKAFEPTDLPHLRGMLDGEIVHLPYEGQTTLPMFMRGGHRLPEVQNLLERFPTIFRDSGFRDPE